MSLAFSKNGMFLASGSEDMSIKIWDLRKTELYMTLEGHTGSVTSLAFSPDNLLLASGSGDRTIKIWDMMLAPPKLAFMGHSKATELLVFSPNAHVLASSSDDQTIKLWDSAKGVVLHTLEICSGASEYTYAINDSVELLAFSPSGDMLASLVYKTIQLWSVAAGTLKHDFEGHEDSIRSMVFSPDGKTLASCSSDWTVCLWNVTTGSYQILEGHESFVLHVDFSPDGQRLASGGSDGTIILWDTSSGAILQTLIKKNEPIRSLVFPPVSNQMLASSGSIDGAIVLWDLESGNPLKLLEGHGGIASLVVFSPDECSLACAKGPFVRIWSIRSGALQQSWIFGTEITDLKFSENGSSLTTNLGSFDIASNSGSHATSVCPVVMDISTQGNEWIVLKGQKALWLPPEFRPTLRTLDYEEDKGCFVTNGNKLAIGHGSGRVSFMSFKI